MPDPIILASGSQIRQDLLRNAGVPFEVVVARVDEDAMRQALEIEMAKPRDVADHLAEAKTRKVAGKHPSRLVLGCDQVLNFQGQILSKPKSAEEARAQLDALSGQTHELISAAVIYENGEPVWRQIGTVRMAMRAASAKYLDAYVARNWESIRHSVGGYKLEEEGSRLFQKVHGDYFHVLGMPLLEVLSYLTLKGVIDG
ncbi:Septum formation protein Maf [Candidatus Rhodobacter oscarellae]|uniref:Nucleoside triphosphate pyrophosphatase n=1 Tax=Candidatus Rhodobacter oscarellae TaxID=1675527 RepID=A0A0J9GZK3_9RHOB|nr:Maf family nucleotide pyrophosphatase [Candidatus Rhodobacter lobularis]KMW58903.1 Septum formation protein Maf [Candidatus Rhodobacter lobularis]